MRFVLFLQDQFAGLRENQSVAFAAVLNEDLALPAEERLRVPDHARGRIITLRIFSLGQRRRRRFIWRGGHNLGCQKIRTDQSFCPGRLTIDAGERNLFAIENQYQVQQLVRFLPASHSMI